MSHVLIATVPVTITPQLIVIPVTLRISTMYQIQIIKQIILVIVVSIVIQLTNGHRQHLIITRQIFN